jgi:hypothetical protein
MEFQLDPKVHYRSFRKKLKSGEWVRVFPGIKEETPVFTNGRISSNRIYYYILFKKSGNIYKIYQEEYTQLKEDKFESEEEFIEKLMVAKL